MSIVVVAVVDVAVAVVVVAEMRDRFWQTTLARRLLDGGRVSCRSWDFANHFNDVVVVVVIFQRQ